MRAQGILLNPEHAVEYTTAFKSLKQKLMDKINDLLEELDERCAKDAHRRLLGTALPALRQCSGS